LGHWSLVPAAGLRGDLVRAAGHQPAGAGRVGDLRRSPAHPPAPDHARRPYLQACSRSLPPPTTRRTADCTYGLVRYRPPQPPGGGRAPLL